MTRRGDYGKRSSTGFSGSSAILKSIGIDEDNEAGAGSIVTQGLKSDSKNSFFPASSAHMTSHLPPTLTINSSHLIETSPLIASVATRVGSTVPRSEFFAAVIEFLQQLSAMDSTGSQWDNQIEINYNNGIDGSLSPEQSVLEAEFSPSSMRFSSPPAVAILNPLPSGSPGYTILPQHIILYIFEYEEKNIADDTNVASLFCRFRSQTVERQYHLQYRSVQLDSLESITLKFEGNLIKQLCRQVRHLRIEHDDEKVKAMRNFLMTMSPTSWPQLKIVYILYCGSILGVIDEQTPVFVRERIGVTEPLHDAITSKDLDSISALLPNLTNLSMYNTENCSVESLRQLPRLKCLSYPCHFKSFGAILEYFPSLTTFEVETNYQRQTWDEEFTLAAPHLSLRNLWIASNVDWRRVVVTAQSAPNLVKMQVNMNKQFDFAGIEEFQRLELFELFCQTLDELPGFSHAQRLAQCQALSQLSFINLPFDQNETNGHMELIESIRVLNDRGQLYSLYMSHGDSQYHAHALPSLLYLRSLGIEGPRCHLRVLDILDYTIAEIHERETVRMLSSCKCLHHVKIDNLPVQLKWELDE